MLRKNSKKIATMDNYDAGEFLIKLLNERFDFKANSGQAIAFDFNTQAYSIFVNAWVDRITMLTPVCVSSTGSAPIYPVDLAMFAWMAAIIHIRKTGQLTGDTIGQLPQFTQDIDVPVPLASILQYIGKYTKHDQNFQTKYALPNGFMNASINVGELNPATTYPFPVYNGGLLWDLLGVSGMGEMTALRNWAPITVTNWCSSRLFLVSNALKLLNIPVVPMSQVPTSAPGPEAYACRGIDQLSASIIPNRVYSMISPIDWELATVFSFGRNRVVQQTWRSEVITSPTFEPGVVYATLSTEHYLAAGLMFLLINQNAFRSGPIKRVYRLAKTRLRTYAWNVKYISGTSVKQQISVAYSQIQQQIPLFSDQITPAIGFRQLYALHAIVALHLHHRCEMNSPFTQQALRLAAGSYSGSAYYNNGVTASVALPSNLTEFIESIGVVVTDGQMVVPYLKPAPGGSDTTWNDPSYAGNLIMMSWKGLNYPASSVLQDAYPFPFSGATVLKPDINAGGFIWDTAFQANYTAPFASTPYPIQHPQFTVDSFAEIWKSTLGSQFFNNLSMSMVSTAKMRQIRFGEAYQMLSIASGVSTRPIALEPVNSKLSSVAPVEEKTSGKVGTPAPTPSLFVNAPVVGYVGSSLVLNGAEIMQATILPASIGTIDINGATSTFLCKMSGSNTLLLLEDMVSKTVQSGLQIQAPDKPKVLSGGELMPLKASTKDVKVSAWDQVVHETSSKLIPPVVGTAATIACDFIPIIGELISPLCGAGAAALATMFTSRGHVTAQHIDASVESAGRAHTAVKSGMQKLGHAVSASKTAVDQASDLVGKFATAQVKGIGYDRLAAHALSKK